MVGLALFGPDRKTKNVGHSSIIIGHDPFGFMMAPEEAQILRRYYYGDGVLFCDLEINRNLLVTNLAFKVI